MSTKEEFVRHIRKTGTSLGINIPLEVIKILELKENEIVRVTVETLKQRKSKISVDLKTKFSNNQRFLGHRKSSGMRVSSRTRSQLTGFSSEVKKKKDGKN